MEQAHLAEHVEHTCIVMMTVISAMLDYPESLSVVPILSSSAVVLRVSCSRSELSKLIGKQGRTARALRTILMAVSKQHTFHLDIVQQPPATQGDRAHISATDVGPSVVMSPQAHAQPRPN